VTVIRDNVTHESRRFGFAEFKKSSGAERAIEKSSVSVLHTNVYISLAKR